MKYTVDSRTRRKLIGLIFLGLAVRVVMPAGYMPAPIEEGGPFVLCPGGLSGASFIIGKHDNAHSHDEQGSERTLVASASVNAWEFCSFGAVLGSAILVTDTHFSLPPIGQFVPPAQPQGSARSTDTRPFHARAPPSVKPSPV